MAKRLIPAIGRRCAALIVLSALGGCASAPAEHAANIRPAGWRIVERVGEARYAPPDASVWLSATTGRVLEDGSKVATGRGGRLILDMPGRHLSVGPASLFVLPRLARGERLDQRAGWLRYRIAQKGTQPFQVHTRALDLELLAGVVDVHVNQLATEVLVKEGQVRVATPDGLRRSQMVAGQAARAGGPSGVQLAVRRTPDAALEPVEPMILPAIHPTPTAPGTPVSHAPASVVESGEAALTSDHATPGGLAETQAEVSRQAISKLVSGDQAPARAAPTPAAAAPAPSVRPARVNQRARSSALDVGRAGAGVVAAPAHRTPAGLGDADPSPDVAQPSSLQSDDAARRRSTFERLTVGMLDGVQPFHPVRPRASIR